MKVLIRYKPQGFNSDLNQLIRSCFAHISDKINILSVMENSHAFHSSTGKQIAVNFLLQNEPTQENLEIAKNAILHAIAMRGYLTFEGFVELPNYPSYSPVQTRSKEKEAKMCDGNYCGIPRGVFK